MMRTEIINAPVFELDDSHPAKRFLEAFLNCKANCVGRHHGLNGPPIDQSWKDSTRGHVWNFSGFAYAYLSLDIELDGFLQRAPYPTQSEVEAATELPQMRAMMKECAAAARQAANTEILALTDQVLEMLSLWEGYLKYRKDMIAHLSG